MFYCYQGLSNKEVAQFLHLSHRDTDNKLRGIDEEISLRNHKQFERYIQENGLNRCIPHFLLASSIQHID
ncbi:hypothetical protein [Candidatus Williamhamiltonella defendens]|uniref:hypothetical protein n=1 Tax=Candidatus Williamhamiltonella defendens TaxID=138072 RepID=UPI001F21E191|nr:hypothetical protein [Candidatus Hamiltonella defensa]